MTDVALLQEHFIKMVEHALEDVYVEATNFPFECNVLDCGKESWTVLGNNHEDDTVYRLDFQIGGEIVGHVDWEIGVGMNSYDFPEATSDIFFTLAGAILSWQSEAMYIDLNQ